MSNSTHNANKQWSNDDIAKLKQLVKGNTPTGLIAYELKRTEAAVYSKASEIKISLKPTNQSPYNRKKK